VLQYGTLNHQTQQLCRVILQRVYLHAYKCLFEIIISCQYYQQYEDCVELAALYIRNGIPIYPYSLGHAYHTIYWKMNIEFQEQLQQHQQHPVAAGTAHTTTTTTTTDVAAVTTTILEDESNTPNNNNNAIDAFYGPARIQSRTGRNVTYLEEKCNFYVLHHDRNSTNSNDTDSNNEAPIVLTSPHRHRRVPTSTTGTTLNEPSTATNPSSLSPPSLLVSPLSSSTNRTNPYLIPVSVHQHLYDRHTIHHEYYIDLQNGTMGTPPMINLSADFFHPTMANHDTKYNTMTVTLKQMSIQQQQQQTVLPPLTDNVGRSNDPMTEHISSTGTIHLSQQQQQQSLTGPTDESVILHRTFNNIAVLHGIISDQISVPLVEMGDDHRRVVGSVNPTSSLLPGTTLSSSSSMVSSCTIDVYSFATMISETTISKEREAMRKHLLSRYIIYQRRLETLLGKGDIYAYEECILDLWDEFFPQTAGIHYYDLETPVPRMSHIHEFLTKPCPKAIGTVQCEIERIKITPRGKGVKGRLFPIYEYRLFIRHRPLRSSRNHSSNGENAVPNNTDDVVGGDDDPYHSSERNTTNFVRRDTVLMVAKNRGRKHTEHNINITNTNTSSSGGIIPFSNASSKKGSNNYYLYMAQQMDVDDHFRSCNHHLIEGTKYSNSTMEPNGASRHLITVSDLNNTNIGSQNNYYDRNRLLGRLQSNFIGTEFQIYIPRIPKLRSNHIDNISNNSRRQNVMSPPFHSDEEIDYDSGMSSDNNNTVRRSRFSRFRRSTFYGSGGTSTTATTTTPQHQHYSTNSDSGSIVTTTATPILEYRTMKRTLSSPENLLSYRTAGTMGHQPPQRPSRISRRAIANDNKSSPSPQRQSPHSSLLLLQEEEAGVITYTANLLGSRPRIMDVCVPKVSADGTVGLEWRQYLESCCTSDDDNNSNTVDDGGCRMLSCFRQIQHRRDNHPPDQPPPAPIGLNNNNNQNHNMPVHTNHTETDGDMHSNNNNSSSGGGMENDFGLLALQNRPPWWNAELGSFVLNFGGRVSVASVKNFQLCIRTNPDSIMLQFGRIHGGRHSFTMDYSHPLTTVQAFSIAISSLQSKISFG
jgi:hypothetical protein